MSERESDMSDSIIEAEHNRQVAVMTEHGSIDPDCATCQRTFLSAERPVNVMAPRHTASVRCQSGKRPHCTCDTCF